MSRAWFLATPLPEPLADDARGTVAFLRGEASAKEKGQRAFSFIFSAVEHSLGYHFREPLAALGVGMMTRKALDLSLDLALKGLRAPMRRILEGMDDAQLRGVADAIEERLYPDPHG